VVSRSPSRREAASPLVAVRLVLSSGAAGDPAGKEGLADFTMRLLRRAPRVRDAHALDEAIEFVGASLGCSPARTRWPSP
jgi:predicted Zn-dependent peptidase